MFKVDKKVKWNRKTNWQEKEGKLLLFYFFKQGWIRIYELNDTAARIFKLCDGSSSTSSLLRLFSKSQRGMVLNFIRQLHQEELILELDKGIKKIKRRKDKIKLTCPPKIKKIKEVYLKDVPNGFHFIQKELGTLGQTFYIPKVNLDITYNCNLKCRHCYGAYGTSNFKDPSTARLKEIIDKLAESNVKRLAFTGGEPFIRKDIFELLKYAHKKGFVLAIYTNGTLLNEEKLKKLKEVAPDVCLQISLDGYKQNHEFLRGPGTFKKVIDVIKLATSMRLHVEISYVAHKKNLFDILRIFLLASKLGVNHITILQLNKIGSAKKENLRLNLFDQLILVAIGHIISLLRKVFSSPTTFKLSKCKYFAESLQLDPEGNIHYCDQIPKIMSPGNIFENDLLDIWHSKEYEKVRNFEINVGEPCKSCIFRNVLKRIKDCHMGCRAEICANTGDFFEGNIFCPLGKISNALVELKGRLNSYL